jgi:hypothetical protein
MLEMIHNDGVTSVCPHFLLFQLKRKLAESRSDNLSHSCAVNDRGFLYSFSQLKSISRRTSHQPPASIFSIPANPISPPVPPAHSLIHSFTSPLQPITQPPPKPLSPNISPNKPTSFVFGHPSRWVSTLLVQQF